MIGSSNLKRTVLSLALTCSVAITAAARESWDQAKAKTMVAKVLEVEKSKKRPWNQIRWRANLASAVQEASQSKKPLFVFFYVERAGPPLEPCGLEGRLLRTHALSDTKVAYLVNTKCVPVKIPLKTGKGQKFPVDWPALKKWAGAFKFSNARGFTGCSVVSYDHAIEYGNSGSAKLSEILDTPAFQSKKVQDMLERALSRVTEERSLVVQRRIREVERKREIKNFRLGVTRAVQSESRSKLPPRGYSLEQALELYQMAGATPEK